MRAAEHPQFHPRRRTVLAIGWAAARLLAVAGSPLLAGCQAATPTPIVTPPPTPTPDEVLRSRAVARIRGLLAQVEQPASGPALRGLLARLYRSYQEQLAALGEPTTTGTVGGSPGPGGTAAGTAPPSTGGPVATTSPAAPGTPATPAMIVAAQSAAATEALTDCTTASAPGMAVLLARLAAAHAAEADLLSKAARLPVPGPVRPASGPVAESSPGPTGSDRSSGGTSDTGGDGSGNEATGGTATTGPAPFDTSASFGTSTPSSAPAVTATGTVPSAATASLPTGQSDALSKLLLGEHASAYAYGVVSARVTPTSRPRAHTFWNAHLTERDDLARLLARAGATAPAASPAYDVGTLPTGNAAAVALAARVEGRLAGLASLAVATTTDGARLAAARILVASARRQAAWTPSVAALPG